MYGLLTRQTVPDISPVWYGQTSVSNQEHAQLCPLRFGEASDGPAVVPCRTLMCRATSFLLRFTYKLESVSHNVSIRKAESRHFVIWV